MCDPTGIMIGMAIGAVTGGVGAAVTGNDIGSGILMGAAMGGVTGGFFPGSVGVLPVKNVFGQTLVSMSGVGLASAGSLALSVGKGLLLPDQPSVAGYTPAAQQSTFQNFNKNVAITGSGGRQAAKSLATAISRTKKRKLTQDDVGDLSIDTSSFTNTGLQLA